MEEPVALPQPYSLAEAPPLQGGDDIPTTDAEMNAEDDGLATWDHEERMEADEAGEFVGEEVMEYDQYPAGEADEDGDVDIVEADVTTAHGEITDEVSPSPFEGAGQAEIDYQATIGVEAEGHQDQQEEEPVSEGITAVLNEESYPAYEGPHVEGAIHPANLPSTGEEPVLSSEGIPTTTSEHETAVAESSDIQGAEAADLATAEHHDGEVGSTSTQEQPASHSSVGENDTGNQENTYEAQISTEAEPNAHQNGPAEGSGSPAAQQQQADSTDTADADAADAEQADEADPTVQDSADDSYEVDDDEMALEPVRLSFQDQSFALFSTDPESTSYLAWDDEADSLQAIPAPRLAVEEEVFWLPLDALFNALRVKDALGEFLDNESGSELVMTFPELEMTVREDNIYAREVSLTDLIRLHHQLGLRNSFHLRISEDSRFISQYNLLAQQIAQAQREQEDHSGVEEVEEEEESPELGEMTGKKAKSDANPDRQDTEGGDVETIGVVVSNTAAELDRQGNEQGAVSSVRQADTQSSGNVPDDKTETGAIQESTGTDTHGKTLAAEEVAVVSLQGEEVEESEDKSPQQADDVQEQEVGEEIIEYEEDEEEQSEGANAVITAGDDDNGTGDQASTYGDADPAGVKREIGEEETINNGETAAFDVDGDHAASSSADGEAHEHNEHEDVRELTTGDEGGVEDEYQEGEDEADYAEYNGEIDASNEPEDTGSLEELVDVVDGSKAEYEENVSEEVGEALNEAAADDDGRQPASPLPESEINGSSKRPHDDYTEDVNSTVEAKKVKVI